MVLSYGIDGRRQRIDIRLRRRFNHGGSIEVIRLGNVSLDGDDPSAAL
jgi:hypothetical protein